VEGFVLGEGERLIEGRAQRRGGGGSGGGGRSGRRGLSLPVRDDTTTQASRMTEKAAALKKWRSWNNSTAAVFFYKT
jgi:hypothetical protein